MLNAAGIYPGRSVPLRSCFLTAGAARVQAKHERAFVRTDQFLCVPELHRLQMVGASTGAVLARAPVALRWHGEQAL